MIQQDAKDQCLRWQCYKPISCQGRSGNGKQGTKGLDGLAVQPANAVPAAASAAHLGRPTARAPHKRARDDDKDDEDDVKLSEARGNLNWW